LFCKLQYNFICFVNWSMIHIQHCSTESAILTNAFLHHAAQCHSRPHIFSKENCFLLFLSVVSDDYQSFSALHLDAKIQKCPFAFFRSPSHDSFLCFIPDICWAVSLSQLISLLCIWSPNYLRYCIWRLSFHPVCLFPHSGWAYFLIL
jgi:hypothetical protein